MNLGSSWKEVCYINVVDNVSDMVVDPEILNLLFILGVVVAVIALIYFLFRGLQQDHETGEYHFTGVLELSYCFYWDLLRDLSDSGCT